MINRNNKILLCTLCLLLPVKLWGADKPAADLKFYDVEVIVFKNIKVPRSHEYNLPTPSASQTKKTLDLSRPSSIKKAQRLGFTPLKLDELRLQKIVDSIIRSSRYSLLIHTGWRQPGLEESKSIPVWVKGGKVFDTRYSSIDQFTRSTDIENGTSATNARRPGLKGLYELEGQITISLSRYLHTNAELVLRKPADSNSIQQQSEDTSADETADLMALQEQLLLNYGLKERRRMRSKRLHYLDHPEFGMIIQITPYEVPVKNVETSEPASTENPTSTPQS